MSNTLKISSVITLALSIYANVRYLVGRNPVDNDPEKDPFFRVGFTPFTGNLLIILLYWGFTHLLQLSFVLQYFFPEETEPQTDSSNPLTSALGGITNSSRLKTANNVGWSVNIFNLLHFVWTLLFVNGHYILSEIVLIINFFNILALYISQATYKLQPLSSIVLIHMPATALPFSWLLYAIFWNGAAMVGSQSLAGRIVANVFIWNFMLVPTFFLAIYRDWSVGFSSSVLMLALGVGQLLTKVFALQWIFAFVISGYLFLASAAVLGSNLTVVKTTDAENAPLINN
jgi:hypothetical protein